MSAVSFLRQWQGQPTHPLLHPWSYCALLPRLVCHGRGLFCTRDFRQVLSPFCFLRGIWSQWPEKTPVWHLVMILAGVFEVFTFKETSKQTDHTMVGLITPGILHPCHLGLTSLDSMGRKMSLGVCFCNSCFLFILLFLSFLSIDKVQLVSL